MKDGGPAFPCPHEWVPGHEALGPNNAFNTRDWETPVKGMSLRDWFATHAPEPSKEAVEVQMQSDHHRNPHGDSYKPKRRSTALIVAQLKYEYADAMLAARDLA